MRHLSLPSPALALVFFVAVLPFATVHDTERFAVGLFAALIGAWGALSALNRRPPPIEPVVIFGLALLAQALGAVGFVSVDAATRESLQPGLAGPVNAALALAGVDRGPLSLDPNRALLEWGLSGAWILLGLAAALSCGERHRAGKMAQRLVFVGVLVVVIAVAHRVSQAPFIWWSSGIPQFVRAPFFAPFVNHNDGGLACAALALLALGLALRESGRSRIFAGLALVLLLAGARLSGSRGALLSFGVGLVVLGAVALGRPGRVLGVLAMVGAALALAVVGAEELGRALSEWMVPEAISEHEDVFTGRADLFGDGLALVGAAPWVGTGSAGFDEGFHMVKSTPVFSYTAHAHQELIQLAAEHGVLVLLLWVIAAGLVIGRVARAAASGLSARRLSLLGGFAGAAAALLTGMMFSFPLRIGALEALTALVFSGLLGLASRESTPPHGLRRPTALLLSVLLLLSLGSLVASRALRAHPSSVWGASSVALAQGDNLLEGADPMDRDLHGLAMEPYRLALRRHPTDRAALQKLSSAALVAGDLATGQGALEVAVRVYPSLPWVHRDLARLLRRLGEMDLARDRWRACLALDLPEGTQEALVAEALKGPGDLQEISWRVLPDRPDRLVAGARVAEQAGYQDLAEGLYRRAADMDPRFLPQLAGAQLRWGHGQDALDTLKGAPDLCITQDVRASALLVLGDGEAAQKAFDQAIRRCGAGDASRARRQRVGLARARLLQGDLRGLDALETLVGQTPGDHALRRVLLVELRTRSLGTRMGPHLQALIDAGVATSEERDERAMIRAGIY